MQNYKTNEDSLSYPTQESAFKQLEATFGKDENQKVYLYIAICDDNSQEFCWAYIKPEEPFNKCRLIFPFANSVFIDGYAKLQKIPLNSFFNRGIFLYNYVFDENHGSSIKKITTIHNSEKALNLATLWNNKYKDGQIQLVKISAKNAPNSILCHAWNIFADNHYILIPINYKQIKKLIHYNYDKDLHLTPVDTNQIFEDSQERFLLIEKDHKLKTIKI